MTEFRYFLVMHMFGIKKFRDLGKIAKIAKLRLHSLYIPQRWGGEAEEFGGRS